MGPGLNPTREHVIRVVSFLVIEMYFRVCELLVKAGWHLRPFDVSTYFDYVSTESRHKTSQVERKSTEVGTKLGRGRKYFKICKLETRRNKKSTQVEMVETWSKGGRKVVERRRKSRNIFDVCRLCVDFVRLCFDYVSMFRLLWRPNVSTCYDHGGRTRLSKNLENLCRL